MNIQYSKSIFNSPSNSYGLPTFSLPLKCLTGVFSISTVEPVSVLINIIKILGENFNKILISSLLKSYTASVFSGLVSPL